MEKEYKSMAETLQTLPKSKPIFIAGHIETPDADTVGGCISLALYLHSLGYQAYALIEEKDNEFLSSWYQGDASLVVNSIEETDYNFILIDCSDKKRLEQFEEFFDRADITINIDHHEGNKGEAKYIIANGDISSSCEMLYEIYLQIDPSLITKDIASLVYSGIMTDTCCFARRLSNRTLFIAQECINKDINYNYLIRQLYSKRSMLEAKTYATLLDRIKTYDNFDYLIIDKTTDEFKGVTHYMITKKISEELRKLDTLENFLILMKYKTKIMGKTMCNRGDLAGRLALYFGGGGHKTEGGFTTRDLKIGEILEITKKFIENDETIKTIEEHE